MKHWGLVAVVVTVAGLGCQSDQVGWQAGSQPVDKSVVVTFAGPQHCGMQDSVLMVIGWPLGHAELNMSAARWYVRNPPEFLKAGLLNDFGSEVTPAKDARYTGYHNSMFELWLAPSDQDITVYIKTEGHFERWPRAKQALMCA